MVDVPTTEQFNSLESRVTTLENANNTPISPPDSGGNPNPGTGTQAKRIVDLFKFGVNTFSSMDTNNVWGSWPADYRPDTVIAAIKFIVQDTGHTISIREYHYAGRESWQQPWLQQIHAQFPEQENIMCVGANGSVNDVASMIALQKDASTGVKYIEGLNEPNTNFGSGEVPYNVTQEIQDAVFNGNKGYLLGPSIVAGTPHPEGWITGYCGTPENLAALNSKFDIGNGHYYPPGSPDVADTGYSVDNYIEGLWIAYAHKQAELTEFHPTLYNSQGFKPGQADWSDTRDAYYTLTTLFRVAQNGTRFLWWYALFDYGTTYQCGLFPTNQDNPRSDAYGLRALCSICSDTTGARRTFDPGKLDYAVSPTDDNISHDLYQSSDGIFYIALWRSSEQPGGSATNVVIDFADPPKLVEEFNISDIAAKKQLTGYRPVQSVENQTHFVSMLDASARIVKVTY
jgi:hypothetical protein